MTTFTSRSGTITLGGTAQTLAAANVRRRGLLIQNLSAGDLWISTEAAAVAEQPSIKIASGATFIATVPDVSYLLVSIIGATTSQAFAAREW